MKAIKNTFGYLYFKAFFSFKHITAALKIMNIDYWFANTGFGFGFIMLCLGYIIDRHEYYKLFTGFDFKNISMHLFSLFISSLSLNS
jgi:hypothetical protein